MVEVRASRDTDTLLRIAMTEQILEILFDGDQVEERSARREIDQPPHS